MKTAILTIQSENYGNRLQNYALQEILKQLHQDVESLHRESGFNGSARSKLRSLKRMLGRIKHRSDKLGAFRRFDHNNISFSRKTASKEYVSPDLLDYDVFVIGSDQVWNPDFSFNSELEYLPMVPPAKKLAYAASFGVSRIEKNRERTAELLNGIPRISVREQAGADIVADFTGREVPVVLDPTMLLAVDDWASVAIKPKTLVCEKPFVFKYVLGNDVNEARIAAMAAEHGLEVIDVMDESLKVGPSEFVWLVARSSLVCTDSFHASVFALLHHKPLAIFERVSSDADMSSRFDTLCSLFDLKGHRSSEPEFGSDAIFGTDWDAFERRLAELRALSRGWLKDSLEAVARG